ncbi:MAG: N-acetyltransferase [Blastocatellia bacterium]|jgi:RimJ/RimL family protein N-acetyltransferase|nr:N-acetyltransferase [Blastocatellia bacterium]
MIETVTLAGRHVRLEPLSLSHQDALLEAASDGELWTLPYTIVPSRETIADYIGKTLHLQELGLEQPFAIVDLAQNEIVGSTRYTVIDEANRKVEIGYTWLARSAQRTAINTESKYLLLKHAFEDLHCIRVELITDILNERSRAAVLRIGARQEGILRNHMIMPNGRYRDSVCFSIIESGWPEVRDGLLAKLDWNREAPKADMK